MKRYTKPEKNQESIPQYTVDDLLQGTGPEGVYSEWDCGIKIAHSYAIIIKEPTGKVAGLYINQAIVEPLDSVEELNTVFYYKPNKQFRVEIDDIEE